MSESTYFYSGPYLTERPFSVRPEFEPGHFDPGGTGHVPGRSSQNEIGLSGSVCSGTLATVQRFLVVLEQAEDGCVCVCFLQDAAKRQFAEELFAYANEFTKALYSPLMSHAAVSDEVVAALDKLEAELSKFDDGPFFLGQFSLADIAYATILERVQIYYSHLRNYDITKGRPNLEKFIEEMNKIEAYTQTKNDPLFLLDLAKNHLKIA